MASLAYELGKAAASLTAPIKTITNKTMQQYPINSTLTGNETANRTESSLQNVDKVKYPELPDPAAGSDNKSAIESPATL